MTDWITDRLPTKADADQSGDVIVCTSPTLHKALKTYRDWRVVTLGWPWRHTEYWTSPTPAPEFAPAAPEPEPEKATRGFAWFNRVDMNPGHEVEEYAVATDGTAWWRIIGKDDRLEDKKWIQVRPLPQPGEE